MSTVAPEVGKSNANKCIQHLKKPLDLATEKKNFHDIKDEFFWKLVEASYSSTLLNTQKLYNLYCATEYISRNNIPGDIVECGVFLGGAMQLTASKLIQLNDTSRTIWLYDTFAGFTGDSSDHDVNFRGQKVGEQQFVDFEKLTRSNVEAAGYPNDKLRFIKGDVSETLPNNESEQLAMLRLDTDTYGSTLAELEHMYPKVVAGGLLILDDYGYSHGVRKAVDEYFEKSGEALFFQRPDHSSRTAIKMS